MDKVEVEHRESLHTSENFQNLLVDLFSKENVDSDLSTATLGSSLSYSLRNKHPKTLGREELLDESNHKDNTRVTRSYRE